MDDPNGNGTLTWRFAWQDYAECKLNACTVDYLQLWHGLSGVARSGLTNL
jgi:hypothetical protein